MRRAFARPVVDGSQRESFRSLYCAVSARESLVIRLTASLGVVMAPLGILGDGLMEMACLVMVFSDVLLASTLRRGLGFGSVLEASGSNQNPSISSGR